jgi:hypothetical protein
MQERIGTVKKWNSYDKTYQVYVETGFINFQESHAVESDIKELLQVGDYVYINNQNFVDASSSSTSIGDSSYSSSKSNSGRSSPTLSNSGRSSPTLSTSGRSSPTPSSSSGRSPTRKMRFLSRRSSTRSTNSSTNSNDRAIGRVTGHKYENGRVLYKVENLYSPEKVKKGYFADHVSMSKQNNNVWWVPPQKVVSISDVVMSEKYGMKESPLFKQKLLSAVENVFTPGEDVLLPAAPYGRHSAKVLSEKLVKPVNQYSHLTPHYIYEIGYWQWEVSSNGVAQKPTYKKFTDVRAKNILKLVK